MTRFPFVARALALSVLLAPGLVAAQTAVPSPAEDLAIIRKRGDENVRTTQVVQMLEDLAARRSGGLEISRHIRGMYDGPNGGAPGPIGIAAIESLPAAVARSQFVAAILVADLDGDWIVTRKEVRQTLGLRPAGQLAEGYLAADLDDDGNATLEEIRVAAERLGGRRTEDVTQRVVLLRLIDFDSDGIVTADEADRAAAAFATIMPTPARGGGIRVQGDRAQ